MTTFPRVGTAATSAWVFRRFQPWTIPRLRAEDHVSRLYPWIISTYAWFQGRNDPNIQIKSATSRPLNNLVSKYKSLRSPTYLGRYRATPRHGSIARSGKLPDGEDNILFFAVTYIVTSNWKPNSKLRGHTINPVRCPAAFTGKYHVIIPLR